MQELAVACNRRPLFDDASVGGRRQGVLVFGVEGDLASEELFQEFLQITPPLGRPERGKFGDIGGSFRRDFHGKRNGEDSTVDPLSKD